MSPFLSFSHPCLSLSLFHLLSLFLSPSPISFFYLSLRDSLCIFLPHLFLSLSSLSLFFSHPYLSISLEPRCLFLSVSLSIPPCLSSYLSLSHPESLFIFLSLPPLSLTFSLTPVSHTPVSSLSLPLLSLFLFLQSLFLSFHLSLFHPCRLPLFLPVMSPFLSFSHPCLPFSLSMVLSLSLPLSSTPVSSYLSLSHHAYLSIFFSLPLLSQFLYPSPSLWSSLFFSHTSLSLSLPRKLYCNIEKENL